MVATLGKPSQVIASELRPGAELNKYPDGTNVQVEKGKVVAVHRAPDPAKPEEAHLQYWRHLWKGKVQDDSEVPGSKDPHGAFLRELRTVESGKGQSVVYEPETGLVKRIVTYAP